MSSQPKTPAGLVGCGDRVQVRDGTLQAFYGSFGTVVKICRCPRDGHVTRVDVRMDELSAGEAYASFYPHELNVLRPAGSSSAGMP
jgi:hypothetical protein